MSVKVVLEESKSVNDVAVRVLELDGHVSGEVLQAQYFEACGFTMDIATRKWSGPQLYWPPIESFVCKCGWCSEREAVWQDELRRSRAEDELRLKRAKDLK